MVPALTALVTLAAWPIHSIDHAAVSALQRTLPNTAPPRALVCELGPRPAFLIRDTDADLLAATGIIQLGPRRLAVVGAPASGISFYELPSGRLTRRAGRVGSGPGEFRAIELVGRSADSLVVWDRRLRRVSIVSPDGQVARSLPFELEPRSAALAYDIQPIGMIGSRRLLLVGRQGVGLDAEAGIRRDSVSYIWSELGSARATLLGKFPGPESATLRLAEGMMSVVPRPLGAPLLVGSNDQGIVVNADGAPSLLRVGLDGSREIRIPIPAPRREPTPAMISRARADAIDGVGDLPTEIVAQLRDAIAKVAAPRMLPAIDALLMDGADTWVREAHPEARGATAQRWHRVGGAGGAASLDLPVAWRVMAFAAGRVVAMEESEEGDGIIKGWSIAC